MPRSRRGRSASARPGVARIGRTGVRGPSSRSIRTAEGVPSHRPKRGALSDTPRTRIALSPPAEPATSPCRRSAAAAKAAKSLSSPDIVAGGSAVETVTAGTGGAEPGEGSSAVSRSTAVKRSVSPPHSRRLRRGGAGHGPGMRTRRSCKAGRGEGSLDRLLAVGPGGGALLQHLPRAHDASRHGKGRDDAARQTAGRRQRRACADGRPKSHAASCTVTNSIFLS